jgi:hypothetical protein
LERAACGNADKLRAWQQEAITEYFCGSRTFSWRRLRALARPRSRPAPVNNTELFAQRKTG